MRRNLTFIVMVFSATLLFAVLQKPLFMLWYAHLLADASAAELWGVVWHGLSLDATIAGYVTALPILVLAVAAWWPHRVWSAVVKWYLVAIAAVTALCVSVNIGLYEYWGFPLDGSIFQFLATPREAMASVTAGQMIRQTVLALVWFCPLCYCYMAVARLFAPEMFAKRERRLARRILLMVVLILVGGLDFLAIRGGVTTAVANVSKAFFSERMVLNHAAVNPAFSLLSSLARADDVTRYDFFDEPTLAERADALATAADSPLTDTLLCTQRPNVVLILAESFGRSTTDAEVDGHAVAPCLARLRGEGVWFENMIASSFRTDRGVLATLSGFPAQPTMSIMKHPQKAAQLPSVARTLRDAGYATCYVHGGDLNFTNMSSYLYATGFERLIALKDMSFDAPTSKWGYADDVVADLFIETVRQAASAEQPYLAVWQTLSSHEPFDVPVAQFEDAMLNSMWFADRQIGRVVEALRAGSEWDNTLVVIIADHAYPYPYGVEANAVARHRIPMLWLGGALCAPRQVDAYCSQSDFAATLLAQLGLPHGDFALSRNIFAADYLPMGYYTFNDGFGVVDATCEAIYDCSADRAVQGAGTPHIDRGKTMLQNTYKIIREL